MNLSQSQPTKPHNAGMVAQACLLLAVLFAAAHPISCNDFWWQLSRGRAVAEGSYTPTQDLVSADTGREGDWLGGLPFYLIQHSLGPGGLMALKIAAAGLVTIVVWRKSRFHSVFRTSICVLMLISSRTAWEPTPVLLETICVAGTIITAQRWVAKPCIVHLLPLLVISVLWSNLGPRSIVCVMVAAAVLMQSRAKFQTNAGLIVAVPGALCLTPAGSSTLMNSAVATFPVCFENGAIWSATEMNSWIMQIDRAEYFAFAALTALSVLNMLVADHANLRSGLVGLFLGQALAISSPENLPLASILISMLAFQPVRISHDGFQDQIGWKRVAFNVVGVCSAASGILLAAGTWQDCSSGPGWGLDPRLDDEAFAASVKSLRITGNAHCVGIREAGLLAWHVRHGIKPYETLYTALLNGRLREHVLLTSDFACGWQTPHRRSNGEWGGWWNAVRQRQLQMLVVPSENFQLVGALEPTNWKPVSLNAVSIVYGKAGDPGCTSQIIKLLSLRHVVNRGDWKYIVPPASNSRCFDVITWLTGIARPEESLHLARVFRAMELNVAALRVLSAIEPQFNNAVRHEFAWNQLALGYRERLVAGKSSRLRLQAFQETRGIEVSGFDPESALNWREGQHAGGDRVPPEVIANYVHGNVAEAIDELSEDRPEFIYARAMLMLEAGRTVDADTQLKSLITNHPEHHLVAAAMVVVQTMDRSL